MDCQRARAVERGHCLATARCIYCLATIDDLVLTNPCSALRAEVANRYCSIVVSRTAGQVTADWLRNDSLCKHFDVLSGTFAVPKAILHVYLV